MNTAIIVLPILLIFAILIIALPVLLGTYVYHDAKARNMDAVLWTIISVVVPSFCGFIIYLIVRRDKIALSCPNCSADVEESYTVCPSCGQRLQAACTNCGTPVKSDWKLCPHCGKEITDIENFASAVPKKVKGGNGLIIAIVSVILLPVLLFAAAIGLYSVNTSSESGESTTIEEFRTFMNDDLAVKVLHANEVELADSDKAWIAECKKGEKGIYSRVLKSRLSDGGWEDADGGKDFGKYDHEIGYMLIVVNTAEGKSCNFVNENHVLYNSLIKNDISILCNEVDMKDADDYGNVFVLKYLRRISVEAELFTVDEVFEDGYINFIITTDSSYDTSDEGYKLSTEENGFVAFKPVEE